MLKNFIKICLSSFFLSMPLMAEEHPMVEGYPPGMLEPVMLPLYCGSSADILTHTTLKMGMDYIMSGEVRRGGKIEGELLGTMSFWYNEKDGSGVFYMTLGEKRFSCLMSYGVTMEFDIEKMLDIVNEEMK